MTPTELRKDLYHILDKVIETGEGVEIERAGGTVVLLPQRKESKLSRLVKRQTVVGDADSLPDISWEQAWQPGSI